MEPKELTTKKLCMTCLEVVDINKDCCLGIYAKLYTDANNVISDEDDEDDEDGI